VPAATSGEHGGDRFLVESKHEIARRGCSRSCRAIGGGRFAKKLAMGEVAEIEVRVAPGAGNKIRAADDGLSFESLEWGARSGFCLHDGGYRGFEVHCYDRDQLTITDLQVEHTDVATLGFARHLDNEASGLLIAAGGAHLWRADFLAAATEEQSGARGSNVKEAACGSRAHKDALIGSRDKQLSCWIGSERELLRMKNPEDANADRAVLRGHD